MNRIRIAIVGDFERGKFSHWATEAALFHAAARVGVAVEPHWIGTASLATAEDTRQLTYFDGIWGAPGSPCVNMAGILNAIQYAREKDVAYLGTCAGFQQALIELSRNVLGVHDADSAENNPGGENIVIKPVHCEAPALPGKPRLAGPGVARAMPGTLLESLCGRADFAEEYFCSFETNADFIPRWQAAGMRVAARGADGEMRALELQQQRFFIATLFQPQLSSSYERPHPIIEGFLRACTAKSVSSTANAKPGVQV
jgi:CTP synthase (UTP-ammonia lyase)